MTSCAELRGSHVAGDDCQLARAQSGAAARARELYTQIGSDFAWRARANWSELAWASHLARPATVLYLLERGQEPAGFFELEQGPQGNVLLAYLGLVSGATGVGLGGYLLTRAVETAWQLRATRRIWLRTSSLDAPRALPNYLARGFRVAGSASFQC